MRKDSVLHVIEFLDNNGTPSAKKLLAIIIQDRLDSNGPLDWSPKFKDTSKVHFSKTRQPSENVAGFLLLTKEVKEQDAC